MVTGAEPVCTADLLAILPALTDHIVDAVTQRQNELTCSGTSGGEAPSGMTSGTLTMTAQMASGSSTYYAVSGSGIKVKQAGTYEIEVFASAFVATSTTEWAQTVVSMTAAGGTTQVVKARCEDLNSSGSAAHQEDTATGALKRTVSLTANAVIGFTGEYEAGSRAYGWNGFSADVSFTITKK